MRYKITIDRHGLGEYEKSVVDYVFEQASVTEKEVTKNVLQKAVESLEEE